MERFDIRNFLTENKLTDTSKRLNENELTDDMLKTLSTFLDREWTRNEEEMRDAISWFANSVYGYNLPNNLHPKDANRNMLTKVYETFFNDVDDGKGDYAFDKLESFLKHVGTSSADKFLNKIK